MRGIICFDAFFCHKKKGDKMSRKRKRKSTYHRRFYKFLIKGKFYRVNDTNGGHPSKLFRKNTKKNHYWIVRFTSSPGRHRTKLKHQIDNNKKGDSYVINKPDLVKYEDFSSPNPLENLKVHKEDLPTVRSIQKLIKKDEIHEPANKRFQANQSSGIFNQNLLKQSIKIDNNDIIKNMVNELLAPAGNLEAVKVAIDNGADAVYCAGKKFGARAFINNLSDEEIIEAARYVHLHSKKIYITLIFEEEFDEVKAYIDFLYHHVDAILVQDYGILHYIRLTYPDFPVHISTQCSIHNVDDIRKLKELGVSRIVLAREVPLENIKEYNKQGVELEVFIHGALCFSYSGMCYLSYYKGGRSGNRGSCAQPCRQNYELLEDGEVIKSGALLSMKDLNIISKLKYLLDVGVSSLKIEGRAKSLEYLAASVRIYRQLIDQYNRGEKMTVSVEMLDDLYSSYSRETTVGYLFGEKNKEITTDKGVKHQGLFVGKVLEYKNNQAKIKLYKELDLLDGVRIVDGKFETGLTITRMFENGNMVKSSSGIVYLDVKDKVSVGALVYKTSSSRVSKSLKTYSYNKKTPASIEININKETQSLIVKVNDIDIKEEWFNFLEPAKNIDIEKVISQFTKTNNLPIEYENIDYKNDDNLFVPIPLINEMRRSVLSKLQTALENQKERHVFDYPFKYVDFVDDKSVDSLELEEGDLNGIIHNFTALKKPFATHISEIGSNSIASPYLGICNHYAVNFFRNLTSGVLVASYESTLDNTLELNRFDKNIGYLIDFKEPLMIAKHCVVAKAKGFETKNCGSCSKHKYQLRDGQNIYDLKLNPCIMKIEGRRIKRTGDTRLVSVTIK